MASLEEKDVPTLLQEIADGVSAQNHLLFGLLAVLFESPTSVWQSPPSELGLERAGKTFAAAAVFLAKKNRVQ